MRSFPRPVEGEHATYYAKYTSLVPSGDIIEILSGQLHTALAEYSKVTEAGSLHRYAPGKWTIKEVLVHIMDAERIFAYRALRFARNDKNELHGFEQDDYVPESGANAREWSSILQEYSDVRECTVQLFRGLPPVAWTRGGVASNAHVSVRALAFIIAGHELHHLESLRKDYGVK